MGRITEIQTISFFDIMSKRAERRHHMFRMREKAKKVVNKIWGRTNGDLELWARKNANHLKSCSCQMCRNPRRSDWYPEEEKKTLQERKADIQFKEQLDEAVGNIDMTPHHIAWERMENDIWDEDSMK